MPDIDALLNAQTARIEEQSTQGNETLDPMQADKQRKQEQIQKDELNREDIGPGGKILDEREMANEASNRVATNQNPITSQLSEAPEAGEDTQGASKTVNNFLSEFGSNVVAGFGSEVVGSTGSIINMIGAGLNINSMYEGNWVGQQLVEAGDSISKKWGTAVPEELMDPELTLQNFVDPQFWSTTISKYIPQLVEFILLSKGAGMAARGTANAIGRTAAKKLSKKGVLSAGRTTLKTSSKSATKAVKEVVEELDGGGWLRSLIRDTGELTTAGAVGMETVGAGAGGNIFSGLMNSSQAYQEKAGMNDEFGNPLYSEEELSNIAADTFKRNLYYMPVDVLSWGMTFGKGGQMLKNMGGAKMQAALKKTSKIRATVGEPFAKISKSNFMGLARIGKTALAEGFEESIQETYEGWSALRATEDALGLAPKYGDASITNFVDYYQSKENEGTILVSGALGGLGGGSSKLLKGRINEQAERERQLYNRTENLKTLFADGDEIGSKRQSFYTVQMVEDAVLNDKVEQIKPILEKMATEGKFSKEEAAFYESLFEEYETLNEEAKALNIRGKVALFKNHTMEKYLQQQYDEKLDETEKRKETIENADDLVIPPHKKKESLAKLKKEFEAEVEGIVAGISQAARNKGNLILGEAAENAVNVEWKSEYGKPIPIVGLSSDDFVRFVQDSDESIRAGKRSSVDGIANKVGIKGKDLGKGAKGIFDQAMETVRKVFVGEEENEEGDINQAEAEESVGEDELENEDTSEDAEANNSKDDSTDDSDDTTGKKEEPTGKEPKKKQAPPKKKTGEPLTNEEGDEFVDLEESVKSRKAIMERNRSEMVKISEKLKDPNLKPEQVAALEKGLQDRAKGNEAAKSFLEIAEPRLQELKNKAENAGEPAKDKNLDPLAGNTVSKARLTEGGIHPNVANKIARKIANTVNQAVDKAKLTAKEKKLYDKFNDTIDSLIEKASDKGKQFSDFVRSDDFDKKMSEKKNSALDSFDNAVEGTKKAYDALKKSKAGKDLLEAISKTNKLFKKTTDDIIDRESRNLDETLEESENIDNSQTDIETADNPTIIDNEALDSLESSPDPMDFVSVIGPLYHGPTEVNIMVGVNERMKVVFPNMSERPRIIVLENLRQALGIQGVGYAIAGVVYVQRDRWDQGETYMHEMMHVFYNFAKNEPSTLAIIKKALQNQKLLEKVLRRYPDQIKYNYKDPDTGEELTNQVLHPEHYNKSAKELKELGVEMMPISDQEVILEEMFAAYMQGPMSEKYNAFFAPRNEFDRQRSGAKWWNSLKDKVDAAEMEADNQELLRDLNDQRKNVTGSVSKAQRGASNNTTVSKSELDKIKTLPFIERIPALIKMGIISSTTTYNLGKRFPIIVNIAGVKVAFYRSSEGTGGKEKGKWTPMFGFGVSKGNPWLIKGDINTLNKNYNSEAIKEYADILNSTLNWNHELDRGTVKNHPFFNVLKLAKNEQAFNKELYNVEDLGIVNHESDVIGYVNNKIEEINTSYQAQKGASNNTTENQTELDKINADNQELLRDINDGKPITTNNMRDYVVQKFKGAVGRISSSEIGFEQRTEDYQAIQRDAKMEIIKELDDQIENFTGSVFKTQREIWENTNIDELSDTELTEEVSEGYDNPVLSILDKTFQAKAGEATKILNQFIKDYNKAVRLRSLHGIKSPQFDRRDFKYRIFEFARYSPDTPTFIKLIEESNDPAIIAFNEFLKINAVKTDVDGNAVSQDKIILNGIRTVMGNFKMVQAMHSTLVEVKGELQLQSNMSLSSTENAKVQTMMNQMQKARDHFFDGTQHPAGNDFKEFRAALERIRNNDNFDNIEDYVFAWKFISNGGQIKLSEILNHGYMNYKGVAYSPITLLKNFVDNRRHTDNETFIDKKTKKKRYSTTPKPYSFLPLVKILASTNRAFTQDSLVQNAKNNSVPVRITNNNMSKELDQINDFLKPNRNGSYPTLDAFKKKFGHIGIRKNSKASTGNQWLNFYYDQVVNKDQIPDMIYYTGIDDRVSNQGKTYDESTAYEQSFEDMMFFNQAKGKLTYLQNMGVLGDSPRKFYIPAKKMVYAQNFDKNGKIDRNSRSVRAAFDIYLNTDEGYDRNEKDKNVLFNEFADALEAGFEREIDFVNNNGPQLAKIKQLQEYFTTDGKLNSAGKRMVKEYALSNALNGYFMTEVFAPNITSSNVDKRLKNSSSPVYSVNKNLKFEMVAYKDESDSLNNLATDGGMYILEKHAKKWQAAGLGVMDLNNGFKFLNFSIEKDNPTFKGKTILLKGYTTVLTENEIKKNPKLRGIANLLEAQDKAYEESFAKQYGGGVPTNTFSDGLPNSFPIAIPQSSIKSDSALSSSENQELSSLSEMNTPEGMEKAKAYQKKTFYKKDGSFIGLSGYNFGPQQVMDKQTYSVTLPVQQLNSLMVYAGRNPEALKRAQAIQEIYSAEMTKNLNNIIKKIKSDGGVEGYKDFLMSNLDLDAMDPVQALVIKKYGIAHLRAHQVVINTLANKLKIAGNKLNLPGSYSHQKSDWGYELPEGVHVNGSNTLQSYGDNADGTTRPAEIILPNHLENSQENGKINKRKYFTLNNPELKLKTDQTLQYFGDLAIEHAKATGKDVNKDIEIAYDKKGKQIGFYVKGDTVLATRVPSNGPNFTGVFEVVDFGATEGNQVQVPAEFSAIIGADLDGDALFIQTKGKNANLNKALDEMAKLWMSKEMRTAITNRMETKKDADALLKKIEKRFPPTTKADRVIQFTPEARRNSYQNSMIASRNIGTVFNLHRVSNTLAAFDTRINKPISVDGGLAFDSFMDTSAGTDSRNHQSALLANIILDNLKLGGLVDKMNLNEHTVSAFALLVNLGVPIESVATIMNAPMVKEYVKMLNENNSAYHGYTKKADMLKTLAGKPVTNPDGTKVQYDAKAGNSVTTDVNAKFYSAANQSAIINILQDMDILNGEVQNISKIMAGHKGIETNPHLLEKYINDFNTIMNNEKEYPNGGLQMLNVNPAMRNNPDIARYKNTAEVTLNETKKLDYVYRPVVTELFKELGERTSTEGLTNNQIKKYSITVQQWLNSRLLGSNTLSEEYFENLVDLKSDTSVFSKLQDHIAKLSSEGRLAENMLLTQALNIVISPNTQQISMNKSFFDDSVTDPEFRRVSREFMSLPSDLQRDLFNYDLLRNRWDGTYSILPIMGEEYNGELMQRQKEDFLSQETKEYPKRTIQKLEELIMAKDFKGKRNNFKSIKMPSKALGTEAQRKAFVTQMQNNPMFAEKMKNNKPFYFINNQIGEDKQTGKRTVTPMLMRFNGVKNHSRSQDARTRLNDNANEAFASNAYQEIDTSGDLDTKLITIKDDNFKGFTPGKKKAKSPVMAPDNSQGRQQVEEFWRYDSKAELSQPEFERAMEYGAHVSPTQKAIRYAEYQKSKKEANLDYEENFEGLDLSEKSDEWLDKQYNKYGQMHAYAYGIITKPIVEEYALRAEAEQTKRTGKIMDGKDISAMDVLFLADNVPSNHPAAQAVVRKMQAEHKRFMEEKKKYAERINKATDNLYQEKFGFNIKNKSPWNLIKRLYYTFLYSRKNLYDNLYGNIVERETTMVKGKPVENFKLKTEAQIESMKANGTISTAEYDFYKMFRNVTGELAPYSSNKGKLRQNYIPHVNMSLFESFANRGILGLLSNSRSTDEKVSDVKMYMKNPINGQKELWKFSDVKNHYKAMAVKQGNSLSTIVEYVKMKRKAKGLLKEHKNEDGSELLHDAQAMDSALDFGLMNRFSHSRSVSAREMPSMDLNHALMMYTHGTLFTNGNKNFQGFKKLQGLLDGVIALNEKNNLGNINKYLKINWKDAYLKGKKQELFGKPIDSVIDFMTKMNLFYQLGGKVSYVVGNVIAGKYHNIKNEGGKSWATGEKRFWGLDSIRNPLDIPKRMKRAQRILKNLNFMDINIYDNVSFQSANRLDNFFGDIALMPMAWSEKWIQSVQFLGLMTEEEMAMFDDNGDYIAGAAITAERVVELENEVRKSQGKGYQMIDQRGIQQYSLGRMFMQFSRFIPTMFYDKFAKADIDIYGKKNIGSLRALYDTVMKVQSLHPKDYIKYMEGIKKTDPELYKGVQSGLRGLAMSSMIGAFAIGNDSKLADAAFWDANYYADFDKLEYKLIPSAARTTGNLVDSLFN